MTLTASKTREGSAQRIMIVEDEFLIAITLEDMLVSEGYVVVGTAASYEKALALAEETRPSLVLMDIHIASERDGVDAATEIYQSLGIRSMFTSANIDPDNVERGKAANPAGWLSKPYSPNALTKAVEEALSLL